MNTWAWLIFIGIGLLMILLELLMGVDTGLDLVFIGSAFIVGGLITVSLHSWIWTLIATAAICILYVFIGRRYIHRHIRGFDASLTNVDTVIGRTGTVSESILANSDGRVIVDGQDWRARADENISQGETVVVTGIQGVTLTVKKSKEK